MKLIALDLDGTLLNSDKVVSERNAAALSLAAAQGNVIAPATGRALRAIPEQVMAFPFVHYAITINGAKVSDTRAGQALLRAEIALDTCLRLLDFVGRYDAMYDCYWNDTGWVDRSFLERVRYYNSDEEVVTLLRTTRAPVDDLKAFLRENGQPVQKVQLCFRDMAERETARAEIAAAFPEILVTSSFRNNLGTQRRRRGQGQGAARARAASGHSGRRHHRLRRQLQRSAHAARCRHERCHGQCRARGARGLRLRDRYQRSRRRGVVSLCARSARKMR